LTALSRLFLASERFAFTSERYESKVFKVILPPQNERGGED
jgi:hypothetical protein